MIYNKLKIGVDISWLLCYNIIVSEIRKEGIKMDKKTVYKEIKKALMPIKEIDVFDYCEYLDTFCYEIELPVEDNFFYSYACFVGNGKSFGIWGIYCHECWTGLCLCYINAGGNFYIFILWS